VLISIAALMTSCGGDDDTAIIIPPPPASTDGVFVTGSATDIAAVSTFALQEGVVEGPGFSTIDRSGYFEAYMYLKAGTFNFSNIDGDNVGIYGGTLVEEAFGTGKLWAGTVEANGTPIEIADPGLYHVAFDMPTMTAYVIQINNFNIIGPGANNATEVEMPMISSSAEGTVFEAENVEMRQDKFKLRFNGEWKSERANATPPADFIILTNIGTAVPGGNETADLAAGGADIEFAGAEAVYKFTLTILPGKGIIAELALVKGADLQPITFDPDSFDWAFIGNATPNGWDGPDHNFTYAGLDAGTYKWIRTIKLSADSAFKIRANDEWNSQLNGGNLIFAGNASALFSGGDNIDVGASADQYYLATLTTSDEGDTYTLALDSLSWGIIGAATPNGWDSSTELAYNGMDSWSASVAMTADEFKFRANNDWAYNLGGASLTEMEFNSGTNFSQASAGTFTVTLTATDGGDSYSATVQ
jgi:hypothetical protein